MLPGYFKATKFPPCKLGKPEAFKGTYHMVVLVMLQEDPTILLLTCSYLICNPFNIYDVVFNGFCCCLFVQVDVYQHSENSSNSEDMLSVLQVCGGIRIENVVWGNGMRVLIHS